MTFLLAPIAAAAPPNQTVRLFEVDDGGGYVERMQISDDGRLLVGRTRDSKVGFLLNLDTWEGQEPGSRVVGSFVGPTQGCDVTAVTTSPSTDGDDVWVACADGRLRQYTYDGFGAPARVTDVDVVVDAATLDGLWYDEVSDALYGWSSTSGVSGSLHLIERASLAVDPPGKNHPKTVAVDGFQEGVLLKNSVNPTLVISHGGARMSHILVGSGANTFILNGATGGFGCSDLCEAPNSEVLCVDPAGAIARYNLTTQQFLGLGLVLDQPRGVGASLEPGAGWVAVTGNQVLVWETSKAGIILNADRPYYESPDADNPIQDIVSADDYLFGGGEAGYVHVVTQNPWIFPGAVDVFEVVGGEERPATTFRDGDTAAVAFAVNQPGTYEVVIGGERPTTGGRVVDSGSLQASKVDDETGGTTTAYVASAQFDVTGLQEGENNVWILAENSVGDVGHAAASLVVDNVPGAPAVALGFGDRRLTVDIAGIPDSDLAYYLVWVSDQPFAPGDFESGGPTTFREPQKVVAKGGEDPSVAVTRLTNDVTYYVAARAYDQAGAESEMSAVKSEIPREVFSVSQQIGETGGSPCSTGPGAPSLLLAAAAAVFARRRRFAPWLLLALPGVAFGADDEDPWWRQDKTPTRANFEVRYGTINLLDPAIEAGYSRTATNLLMAEVGPQFFHVVEVDLGFGFFQELDFMRTADGVASSQRQMLTWFPMQLDATLRGHFVDEQPAVPFVRYGWDYIPWSEKYDTSIGGPKAVTRGSKFGTHYAIGANLLLDLLQPARASFLEARTGINDSWITIEYRWQRVDGRARPWSGRDDRLSSSGDRPFDFSGSAFTLGLKLDW